MTTIEDPVEAARLRSKGRSVQDYLRADSRTVPPIFMSSEPGWFGTAPISKDRYLSREWQEREMQYLWPRVWQMACHTQQIPNVGDTVLYQVGTLSYLIVRSAPDTIRAFYNACLHRGTKLRVENATVSQLRCPFHAWTWSLDGDLVGLPGRWDFPQVDAAEYALPQVRVDVALGFVFICPDPDAVSLGEWMGPLPDQLSSMPLEKRRLARHVRRVVDCNWKVALEAFLESYHVTPTHPQYAASICDLDSQYDVLSRYVNRMITPIGVPGPTMNYDVTDEELMHSFAEVGLVGPDGNPLPVAEGKTARETVAEFMRSVWLQTTGVDVASASDAEMLDGIGYQLFPNFLPWAGLGVPLAYRFLPYRDDPDRCTMEFFILWPHPEGEPFPPAPETWDLCPEDHWSDVAELSWLGPVFDQDHSNLPRIHEGLRSLPKEGLSFGAYQESRIRHFHALLEEYLKP